MKLDNLLKIIQYNVGEVSDFLWDSLGNCRIWAFNNVKGQETGTFIVNKEGEVLEIEVYYDYGKNSPVCYRWICDEYKENYLKEVLNKTGVVDYFENMVFIDVEEEDCIEKLFAIIHLKAFDPRAMTVVDFTDEEFIKIAKMAHEADITFNEQVNIILSSFIAIHGEPQAVLPVFGHKNDQDATHKVGFVKKAPITSTVLEVQEDDNGELYIQFTPELLEQLCWKEGDTIDFDERPDGSFMLKKV